MPESEVKQPQDCILPEEVLRQLSLLDTSQYLIAVTLAGLLMRYQSIAIQRDMLLTSTLKPECFDPDCYPELFPINITSSLLVLYSLFGFYFQAGDLTQQACEAGLPTECPALNQTLTGIIILVALIRLAQELDTNPRNAAVQTPEQEEVIDTAVI